MPNITSNHAITYTNNIKSLKRNFKQFHQHVLSELKVSFGVIGLTEIRIRDGVCNENLPSLPNYYFEYVTTPLSAGSVGMFNITL